MRASYHKLPRGIHVKDVVMDKGCGFFGKSLLEAWDENLFNVFPNLRLHGGIHLGVAVLGNGFGVGHLAKGSGDEFVVLGTENDGVDLHGGMGITVVLNGELALGIRPEVRHKSGLIVADVRENLKDFVAQIQRQRHVVLRVTAGVPEHHSLVSCALVLAVLALNAAVYVRALLVERAEDAATGGVKHIIRLGVANFTDGAADGVLDVYVGFGLHFTHYHHHTGRAETLAGHFGLRVLH